MPELNYEDTFIEMSKQFREKGIPVRSLEIDSYWYEKDLFFAVKNWTVRPDLFPNGLKNLAEKTQWKIVAHNRHWSSRNVYTDDYDFIRGSFFKLH